MNNTINTELEFKPYSTVTCKICGEIVNIIPIIGEPFDTTILNAFIGHINVKLHTPGDTNHKLYMRALAQIQAYRSMSLNNQLLFGLFQGSNNYSNEFQLTKFEQLDKELTLLATALNNEEIDPLKVVTGFNAIMEEWNSGVVNKGPLETKSIYS